MAINRKRTEESRAVWLHTLTPFMSKYATLSEMQGQIDAASSTLTHNINDLVKEELITEKRFNLRRFIEITPKGEELRSKYEAPPLLVSKGNRQVFRQQEPPISSKAVPVDRTRPPYIDAPQGELEYIEIALVSLNDLLDNFSPILDNTTIQLRSAATMLKSALDMEQQTLQFVIKKRKNKKNNKAASQGS